MTTTTDDLPMTDQRLAEIEARWHGTTPGPWEYTPQQKTGYGEVTSPGRTICDVWNEPGTKGVVASANGLAIAAAPSDVRELVAEVRKLRAELAPFRELASEAATTLPDLEDEEFRAECMARLGEASKALIEDAATLIQRLAAHHKEPST
jgi:hypothetical protein